MDAAQTHDLLFASLCEIEDLIQSSMNCQPIGKERRAVLRLASLSLLLHDFSEIGEAKLFSPQQLLQCAFDAKRARDPNWYAKAFIALESLLPNASVFASAKYRNDRLATVSAETVVENCESWSELANVVAMRICRRFYAIESDQAIHLECKRLAAQKELPTLETMREISVSISQELKLAKPDKWVSVRELLKNASTELSQGHFKRKLLARLDEKHKRPKQPLKSVKHGKPNQAWEVKLSAALVALEELGINLRK